jgi:hypothetical protein
MQLQLMKAPAPPPVIDAVQEVVVETSLDVAGAFSIRLGIGLNQLGDYGLLMLDPFKPGLPIGIRIGTGVVPVPMAVINGFASGQRASWAEGGKSALTVHGTDITGMMNLEEKVRPWPSMPDGAIAAAIFGTYAVVPQATPTPPRLVEPLGTTVQRGTDIRFLRRLARRNGFDCYVQPEALSGLDIGHFGPPVTIGVPQAVLNVNMGADTNVRELTARYDMLKPTTVVSANLDTATKAPQAGVAPLSLIPPMGLEPAGVRAIAGAGLAAALPLVRPADSSNGLVPELQAAAQGIADRSSFAVVVEGLAGPDVGVLRPGGLVALRGVGRLFTGLYQLTKVRLTLSEGRLEQRFTARRNAVTMTGAEPFAAL